jgi:hypothetical protein
LAAPVVSSAQLLPRQHPNRKGDEMDQEQFEDAQQRHVAGRMHQTVADFATGREMNRDTIAGVQQIVETYCQRARGRGIKMPPMTVLGFASCGAIEIVRKDWERDAIERWAVNMTVKYPTVTAQDLARAISATWPMYRSASADAIDRAVTTAARREQHKPETGPGWQPN